MCILYFSFLLLLLLFLLFYFIYLLQQSRCAYVIIVMAALWLTEAIPIPVTALIPIFLFPMLQVAEASAISGAYITVIRKFLLHLPIPYILADPLP